MNIWTRPGQWNQGLSSGTFVELMDLLPSAHDHVWPPVRQADLRDSRKRPGLVPSVLWSQLWPDPALCILSWLEPVWIAIFGQRDTLLLFKNQVGPLLHGTWCFRYRCYGGWISLVSCVYHIIWVVPGSPKLGLPATSHGEKSQNCRLRPVETSLRFVVRLS